MLECRDIDALMMDWLYQELEASQSGPFDDHLARCTRCQAEIEGLKRTRAALRDLPQVEPPASITQILLHEAARKAPAATAAEPGGSGRRGVLAWLGDLFTPIARHPAATAIATLVVVAGVAGTIYLKGGHEVAQPQADSAAPPPAETPAESTAVPGSGLMLGFDDGDGITARLEEDRDLGGAAAAEPAAENQAGQPQFQLPVPPAADPAPGYWRGRDQSREGKLAAAEDRREAEQAQLERRLENKPRANAPGATRAGVKGKPTVDATAGADQIVTGEGDSADEQRWSPSSGKDLSKRDAPARIPAGGAAGGRGPAPATTVTDTEKAPSQPAKKPEPSYRQPMAEPPPSPPADKLSQQITGNYRVYLQNPQDNSFVTSKESQLEQALRRNDCPTAGRIANDILDRSYEYYVANVKPRAEKSCKKFVDAEWRARYAARVERARKAQAAKAKGGGGSTGTANKAKAAPRQDDAAESMPAADSN